MVVAFLAPAVAVGHAAAHGSRDAIPWREVLRQITDPTAPEPFEVRYLQLDGGIVRVEVPVSREETARLVREGLARAAAADHGDGTERGFTARPATRGSECAGIRAVVLSFAEPRVTQGSLQSGSPCGDINQSYGVATSFRIEGAVPSLSVARADLTQHHGPDASWSGFTTLEAHAALGAFRVRGFGFGLYLSTFESDLGEVATE